MPVPVRMRLALHGQKHTPYFHLVVINSTKRRDASPIEKLGEYDPIPRVPGSSTSSKLATLTAAQSNMPLKARAGGVVEKVKEKRVVWDEERIRYWLRVGAQPTESVVKLLERGGILVGDHKFKLHPSKREGPIKIDTEVVESVTSPAELSS